MPLYFAYGSNLNHTWMEKRCQEASFLSPARLDGYSLAFLYRSTSFPGGGAADIVQDPDSFVWGALWRATSKDMIALDQYEDVATGGYRRTKVWTIVDGRRLLTTTYEVVDKLPEEMMPRENYLATLLEGAEQSSLPESYIASVAKKYRVN